MDETRNMDIEEIKEKLRDQKVVISMFCGELGWFLQRYQAHLRYLKRHIYQDWNFIIMCNEHLHIFVDDFVSYTFSFPEWFYNLGLDCDGYEAVEPNSPPGSMTPPAVYQNLTLLLKEICGYCKEYELLLPPRGCNAILDTRPQMFFKFDLNERIKTDKPIIVVFPRARTRASNRNVPEFVWKEVVSKLSETFTIVLAGTPSGACLKDLQGKDIINLINYNEIDKTELIIKYLNNAICSVSSQSGGTHISLLSGCNSYIIGHEKERHVVRENRLDVPTSFRVLYDYRAIDAQTILKDLREFIKALFDSNWFSKLNRPSLKLLEGKKDLVGAEIGVGIGENAFNILQNLDIKKLYLIDPYVINDYIKAIGGRNAEQFNKSAEDFKNVVLENLKEFKDKIEWIYDFSENAADKIKEALDFVYIDGDHNYEFVKEDIKLYSEKVKDGGLVAGHDFENEGVQKAVYEAYDKSLVQKEESDWWIVKPNDMNKILAQDYETLLRLVQ